MKQFILLEPLVHAPHIFLDGVERGFRANFVRPSNVDPDNRMGKAQTIPGVLWSIVNGI